MEETVGNSSTPSPATVPSSTPSSPSPAASPSSALDSMNRAASSMESAPSADAPANLAQSEGTITPPGTAALPSAPVFHLPKSKEDYDRIMANARQKAQDEIRQKLGWAEQFDPTTVHEALQLIVQMREDPQAFAQELLGSREEELVDPDPDYNSPDGKAQFYSKATLAKLLENHTKRLMKQLQPVMNAHEQQQQAARIETIKQEGAAVAREAMEAISQYPHYKELAPKIREKLAALDASGVRRRIGAIAALHMAYQSARNEMEPLLKQQVTQQVRDGFTRQAAASVGHVQPGNQTVPRKPVRDGDVDGLAKRMEELAAQ